VPLALPTPQDSSPEAIYEAFESWTTARGIELYDHQQEAILELVGGSNVILSTPTGSGKSLVATAAHFSALSSGQRSFYTAPIKALVSEKFFELIDTFGADNVGMMTGDAAVNADAPIVAATAEVLANLALRGVHDIGQVIMDEFHYYGDGQRGWAWQVPLLELENTQFLLMSATLGETKFFAEELTRLNGRNTATIADAERPVPLNFEYVTTAVHETIETLLAAQKAPIYVVHSTQADAIDRASAMMSINVSTKDEKSAIKDAIGHFRFRSSFGKSLQRYLKHGIGVHHAGMLPKYRRLVEQLAQAGHLKVICGTDTLGVGVNMPIRTVLLTSLTKFDGKRVRVMKAREFHQIIGRAGRAGHDVVGYVVAQAPEHVVENAKAAEKAANSSNKKSKAMVKKAPDGFVNWSNQTFERLMTATPETLQSHFRVSHAMVLNVIARPSDPVGAMKNLLTANHDNRNDKRRHIRQAIAIYRSLIAAEVIERLPVADSTGRTIVLKVDLQANFALNQPLSTFALAAFDLLDADEPTHPLDVLSVIEATLDDPRQILFAQESKEKGEALGAMKAAGIEYEERMEKLAEVSWPKPLRELLDDAYLAYGRNHPWVFDHQVSPKSVVRDMYERAMSFNEFVGYYKIARSEGLLLRYMADAYRALRQTVPDEFKVDELLDIQEWLGAQVRQTDSSLIDEWESLRNPKDELLEEEQEDSTTTITSNERAFKVLVRNAMFRRVELAARREYQLLGELDLGSGWSSAKWREALEPYFAAHNSIGTGANARGPQMLVIDALPAVWRVRQIFEDPDGDNDWGISAEVDLAASDEAGELVLKIQQVGQL
jgi:superfamily II RNA helicase